MFRAIFYTQWKWTRLALLPCSVIAFALPILSVRHLGSGLTTFWAMEVLDRMRLFSVWYPALAAATGLIVAVSAWREDHRHGHVYALSLPVERWRFALLRYGSGALLLAGPILALWLGAAIASWAASVPPGLRAYPTALAVRFALALLVAYSIFFAISAGTTRTAAYVLGGLGAVAIVAILVFAAGVEIDLAGWLLERVMGRTGPLNLFT
ncbi:MAG: hypothetical protein GWN99_17520, partial [Gemmatimonadetes bacterium]|nr:hypothetical protein [Gemmatimonadota bacterium]NIR74648.1 hypothetical protein [Candidatus Kutchimonas denitrificans]NIS02838.1 hypothetical protein [Gemmatimonadota bacterium]NIT68999.1 hypothetical protein [Gemmatimonadota bacterium]NIU52304.1 hypothetical protein [Gemmatimonadota bacterium]